MPDAAPADRWPSTILPLLNALLADAGTDVAADNESIADALGLGLAATGTLDISGAALREDWPAGREQKNEPEQGNRAT